MIWSGFLENAAASQTRRRGGSTALGDKALERRGETVERLLEELDLLRRDVGGRLGAFGDSLDGRQVQLDDASNWWTNLYPNLLLFSGWSTSANWTNF